MDIERQKAFEERTLTFTKQVLDVVKHLSKNVTNQILVNQIVRSASSIGANYQEACDAESKLDFVHKIKICKKETRETKYWLQLICHNEPSIKVRIDPILAETEELLRIFSAIIISCRKTKINPKIIKS